MDWKKVSKSEPCQVCGHPDWCRVTPDGCIALCSRKEQGCIIKKDGTKYAAANGMGWLHSLKKSNGNGNYKPSSKKYKDEHLTISEVRSILKRHQDALTKERLKQASESLGLSIDSLEHLQIGYDIFTASYSFPMSNGKGQPIGIRLRAPNGKKSSVKGSHNGIFIPTNYDALPPDFMCDAPPRLLLIPEGPTDCAACLELGLRGVGRPSNSGGIDYIRELLMSDTVSMKQDVAIIADNDPVHWTGDGFPFHPGADGALALADAIYDFCGTLRIVRCPDPAKDIRKLVQMKGTADTIEKIVNDTKTLDRTAIKQRQKIQAEWRLAGHMEWLKKNGNGAKP